MEEALKVLGFDYDEIVSEEQGWNCCIKRQTYYYLPTRYAISGV